MTALTKQDRGFLRDIKVAWDAPEPVSDDVRTLQYSVRTLRERLGELIDEREAVMQRNGELEASHARQGRRIAVLRGQLRNARRLMLFFFLVAALMAAVIGYVILFPGTAGL